MADRFTKRFKSRRRMTAEEFERLDRSDLLKTAHVMSTEDLNSLASSRPRRRRVAKSNESTPEVELDQRMLAACFREIHRGVPAACLRRLRSELRNANMIFTLGSDELEPSVEFARVIQERFLPVQDDTLVMWLAMGAVPMMFVRNAHNDEVYPQVPAWGSFTITIQSVLGQPMLRFYWRSRVGVDGGGCAPGAIRYQREQQEFNIPGHACLVARGTIGRDSVLTPCDTTGGPGGGFGTYDPTVVIISNLGYDPSLDGTINSVMASVFEDYVDYNKSMRVDAIIAGRARARPPIATEYNPDRDKLLPKAADLGHFVGDKVLAPGEEQTAQRRSEIYVRSLEEREAQTDQYRLIHATMGPVGLDQYGVKPSELGLNRCTETTCDFNTDAGTDEMTVADDRKLSSALPKPEVRSDIVPAMKANDEAIAAAFGLSLTILNGETTSAKSGTELSTTGLNKTMSELNKMMSSVFQMCYDHIWLEQDVFALLSGNVRTQPNAALTSQNRLFGDPANVLSVRVAYRFTPTIDLEKLRFLHGRGIIDYRRYATYAARMQGLMESDVATTEDPLDVETGRALDIPEYMTLLQMRSAEKTKDKELKSAAALKERDIESTATLRDREMKNDLKKEREKRAADEEDAAEKPAAKKKK